MSHILALDQGTTSSRAILFDRDRRVAALARRELTQHLPRPGWVEHSPDEIWESLVECARAAIAERGRDPGSVAAIGIANQRETSLVWERASGRPLCNAIVWQDRRTAGMCRRLKTEGHEAMVAKKTGLLLDPYFSGTKLAWILDRVEGARAAAEKGELLFGTVDSYLVWRLTGGAVHATDATNASRTLLYDIVAGDWDDDLCRLFRVPRSMLPEVRDSSGTFGTTVPDVFGRPLPILGVAGDQHAALLGQACFRPGMLKSTYGTGCFALLNTGARPVRSRNRLLTTIAYRLDGRVSYALEGSIFIAGAVVQWLRDGLKIVDDAARTGSLAAAADPEQSIYLVPAFTGLGAPWWDPDCRGAIFGLTRATGPAELARAALESVGYQTRDLWQAMAEDWPGGREDAVLRADGGMAGSDWTMQFLADILGLAVDRPGITETTALGAAWLAGRAAGIWPDAAEFAAAWRPDTRFMPRMDPAEATRRHAGWRDAVRRTLADRNGAT